MSVTEASIEYLSGDVLVNNTKAEVDDKVQDKSIVATGDDGICEIIFNNKNIIRVLDNTTFELDFPGVKNPSTCNRAPLLMCLRNLPS
ncbi:MAG: hypothetical protein JXB88_06635 [Spirochaetales bacterium]|nr:hypothetical protein [Spirochaetales bacterium]